QRLIAEPQTKGDWTRVTPMFERPIYRSRTMETAKPLTENAVAAAPSTSAAASSAQNGRVSNIPATEKRLQRQSNVRVDSFNTPFEQLGDLLKD
ncbi:MAG TPA: hypothetical protein VEF04_02590, partial [Blastocatellia bacterium]|nr:hypothetical protein [Blastocatellia bacterium]